MEIVLNPLASITLVLLLGFVLSEAAYHFKYPRVLGQILAGMVVGLPLVRTLLDQSVVHNIGLMAQIGIIFLFLVLGMEMDWSRMKKERARSIWIGAWGIVVPVAFGVGVGLLLGYSVLTSLVIGVCLAITSESTSAQVFLDMGVLKKRLAQTLFGAGLMDAVLAMVFVTFLLGYAQESWADLGLVVAKILAFIVLAVGLLKVMPFFVDHIENDASSVAQFSLITLFGLGVSIVAIEFGVGEVLGAFMAGVILKRAGRNATARHHRFFQKNADTLKVVTLSFIIPFFFIDMGLEFDYSSLAKDPWVLLAILVAAIAGKHVAAICAKSPAKLSWPQVAIVGWGMNARGALELVVAKLALIYGLIGNEVYSALVLMVLVTTLSFPIFLKQILRRHPRAMDIRN